MIRTTLAVLGFIAAGAIYLSYTQPTYGNVKLLKAEIAQYNQALDKAAELKKLKEALLSRYNAFDPAAKEHLHKLLPDHVDNVRLILDIDSLAAQYDLAIENVSIKAGGSMEETVSGSKTNIPTASGGTEIADASGESASPIGSITAAKQKYDSLSLKFTTRTSYENFIAFIEALQASLRLVDIVSIEVAPEVSPSEGAGSRLYKFGVQVRTYWLR